MNFLRCTVPRNTVAAARGNIKGRLDKSDAHDEIILAAAPDSAHEIAKGYNPDNKRNS